MPTSRTSLSCVTGERGTGEPSSPSIRVHLPSTTSAAPIEIM